MPRSNSVIRRYTPPTCTLEILAQSSPLSRWMGQTVLKQLHFELHFDDPGLPDERQVPIQGDRDQLEALCNAVTNYVQNLLQQSADSFCLTFLKPHPSNPTSDEPELDDFAPTSSSPKTVNSFNMGILEATIYLESSDNLTHKLFLGSLANPTSGPVIQLTLLQLFDLATALEEYSTDVIALPNLNSENSTSVRRLPTWTPVAATLALALGLTPLTWQYANNIKQQQKQVAKTTTSASEKVALESSPSFDLTTPPVGLASPGNLPSPPSNSTSIQLPNLDTTPPLADTTVDPKPLSFPNSTVPSTANTSSNIPLTIPQTRRPVIPANLQIPLPTTPNPQQNSTGVTNQSGVTLNPQQNLPTRNSNNISTIPESGATLPQTSPPIAAQTNPQQLNRSTNSPGTIAALENDENLVAKLREARKTTLPKEVATSDSTLFDIPQVAEARQYLQKNWQPPAGFSQTLEYSLMLGVDGSIERILPLNRSAREYFDSTGIPAIGKAFVSTNKSGQNLRLRVVFSPDGKVQTFPETP
ncbi:DUF4335 domain-containing protein [Anabaena cylindrica FACHB-243]|uniref:DUF4335 domain-containing protein n=1 Tax=Anabaena cylindrica (strain ATCC 27899 / PCC 7122) TaxID=272123 RepID=K9ZQ16_ANACC|nr:MULTISPECIES: DUF4335 domain-containing protein [Anabaena]AFZ60894.1 hypothetical protein Anacy_5585 [Anabaena cylindrica PCC 7122]MBD2420486.1 DUF4335 domain-containing protein [Anabaena cylindrica FACHB-243]MBY5282414.1 DUF4335 domain-containing protein [Anabaena sp. CCAP 1446/1C]MBY5306340.1 DUF4335 domain-containing protein [Anabaena sp. CCAP 1446/1C]MCM2406888.1 DUF4335 domain-containing protein [Anabaena sp. CCAP 1446/1C]